MSTYRKTRFSVSHIIFCYIIISHSIGAVWQSYKTYKLYNLDLFFIYEEKKEITSQLTNSNFNIQGRILTTPPEKLNLSSIEFPKNVNVIVIVCQTPEDVESRRQIRQGWANKANYDEKNNSIYVQFLVGTRNNFVSPILLKESNEYGDIFIADIEESYRNLVYKLMVVYNWISHFLYPVYVVKIDNDTVIDLNQLNKVISDQTTEKWIVGKVVERAMPSRDPNNKYYISPEDYRGSVFPSYTDGPLYIISPDALKEIVLHLDVHPAIHLEDVYFTGILASNASIPLISDSSIFNKKPICYEMSSDILGFPAHNSKVSPKEEYKWFMAAKKGNCT